MAITGISSYDGKQIIAAGTQSAISAGIASNLNYKDEHGTQVFAVGYGGPQFPGGLVVGDSATDNGVKIYPSGIEFLPWEGTAVRITSGKVTAWDSLSTNKQDKLTFGYTNDQISQINGSAIYSQGGGGGVVTATGGTTTYVQTINGKNISATNAGSALSATDAYNLTNTAIKVASATSASTAYTLGNTAIKVASAGSASTAYTLGNTAIKVASATSATNANTATYASNGVSLTNIYNSGRSGYAASAYLNANVTGYTANWQKAVTHLTPHIFQGIQYTAFDTSWGYGNSPVATPWIVTATNGQGTDVKIRLNYGKILPHCSAVTGKVAVYPVDKQFNNSTLEGDGIPWYRVDIDLKGKGYYGTQWAYQQGAIELSGCWSPIALASNMFCEWSPDTQVQVVHNDSWNNTAYVNVIDVIHRDINTAVGDNNKWHMCVSFLVRGYGN